MPLSEPGRDLPHESPAGPPHESPAGAPHEPPARDGLHSVCLFCGSSDGADPAYREAATALGRALALAGRRLVYGGAHVGLMGAAADAALAAGGEVVGVIPRQLMAREVGHTGLTELRVVGSMHERKAAMAELSDAFVVLPGGMGTLEEFFEVWTWAQLGIHAKPVGLLDVAGFFAPLLGFLDHAVAEGFVRRAQRDTLVVETSVALLLARLAPLAPLASLAPPGDRPASSGSPSRATT